VGVISPNYSSLKYPHLHPEQVFTQRNVSTIELDLKTLEWGEVKLQNTEQTGPTTLELYPSILSSGTMRTLS
jgi:hypothetical protein